MGNFRLLQIGLFFALIFGIDNHTSAFIFSKKIDSIQLIFDKQQLVLPGENFNIGIIAYHKNGKITKTRGMTDGSVFWWNYKVEVIGGSHLSGRITVDQKSLLSFGQSIKVRVYPRKHPELAKELSINLNYETKITFKPFLPFSKAPGNQIKGELYAEFDNGNQLVYSKLRNRNESDLFQFTGFGGIWDKGKFTIEPNITKIDRHFVSLIINSVRNPSIADTFAFLLDYKNNYELNLRGSSGSSGFSGSSGSDGAYGRHGSDGQNGQHGEFGYDGPDIDVWADLYYDSILNCKLLYVFAEDVYNKKEYRYLLNPEYSSFTVSSTGGSGGSGGSGGNGGDGGDGLDGEIWIEKHMEKKTVSKTEKRTIIKKEKKKVTNSVGEEIEIEVDVPVEEEVKVNVEVDVEVSEEVQGRGMDGGNGGWGGAGGLGGDGGYGGNITIYVTDDARPYLDLIIPVSQGGSGGINGCSGIGGKGGSGGQGNPSGNKGADGYNGPYRTGWAMSGEKGIIAVEPTEEFMTYSVRNEN